MTARLIPAVFMRGGTARGLLLHGRDLPRDHAERDALLLRALGGPDPDGRWIDGVSLQAPGSNRLVLVTPSRHDDCDIDCVIGSVAADGRSIDWTSNTTDLLAAASAFAIAERLVHPVDGLTRVLLRTPAVPGVVEAFVPVRHGQVLEDGQFVEDGVPFAGAEIRLEFTATRSAPGDPGDALLPTGQPVDLVEVPGLGQLALTVVNLGAPVVFVRADALKLTGRETVDQLAQDRRLLSRLRAIRASAAARIAESGVWASAGRDAMLPELAWIARPVAPRGAAGQESAADQVDLLVRVFSDNRMHAACGEAGPVAVAVAAALPGTVVAEIARTLPGVQTRIGHASGTLAVGAEVSSGPGGWQLDRAVLSRGARRLMSGVVHVPPAGVSAPT